MDSFDRRLLDLVQRNNRLTYDALGDAVGLSPSAVRRRLKQLRVDGVIIADVALADPAKLAETVIISVHMKIESHETYATLSERMRDCPEVSQCYTVCGDTDFIIIAHFGNLTIYDGWAKAKLMSDPAIARYTTHVVSGRIKYDTAIATE